ncbi:Fc.00g058510.m01.CDS01 [Cosmosporella sp. VM-42]
MLLPSSIGTLIIGAGPTGLGAAYYLNDVGDRDWIIIDASSGPGGMAATFIDEKGFHWDTRGHVIHSHFQQFDTAIAHHQDWELPRRGGWVRVGETWCPTPIQCNIGSLAEGPQIAKEISLIAKSKDSHSQDLQNYYEETFGTTLNDLFFAPFNLKQWGWPLSELSHTWTSLRSGSKAPNVPAPNASSAGTMYHSPEDTPAFIYPSVGTGSLWKSIAQRLPNEKQQYGIRVTRLSVKDRYATLSAGQTIRFKHCISTIPVVSLLSLVIHERPELGLYTDKLLYTSTYVMGLGFEGQLPPILAGKTWIYSADSSIAFHRASIPTNFSPVLSGDGRWSIMFETSISTKRQLNPDSFVECCLKELRRWGIHDTPISIWKKFIQFGYPIPFLGRDELLERLLPEFEQHNVLPRGRFGGWRYESSNQDYAFMQGMEAVQSFRVGCPETAYWPGRRREVNRSA